MLLALWLLSQTLGFALPAPPSVAEREMPPCLVWEQSQAGNHGYDAGFQSSLAWDPELASAAMAGWSDMGIPMQATPGYDCVPVSLYRKAGSPRAPPVEKAGFLAAETGASRLRLNVFGEGEARGFLDVASNARFANGRPLTTGFGNGSASDIFIRNARMTGESTTPEILRLSQLGTRITLMQPASGFQGQSLVDAFGSRATVDFMRMFPSQTVAPGVAMTTLRMTVGGR